MLFCLYYRPKRSFGQGNIFTSMCLSTGGGGYPSMPCKSVMGGSGPWGGVSNFSARGLQFFWGVSNFWGGLQFFRGSPIFRGVSNFSGGLQFWGGLIFFGGGNFFLISALFGDTPPPLGTRHWNTVNVRPVRILLECILVKNKSNRCEPLIPAIMLKARLKMIICSQYMRNGLDMFFGIFGRCAAGESSTCSS